MFDIHADIRKASTLPTSFYASEEHLKLCKELIFSNSWQFTSSKIEGGATNSWLPIDFLGEFIPEPVLLTRDGNSKLCALSNVCTHRGMLIKTEKGFGKRIQCPYHGRCFAHNGDFISMPMMKDAENFPTKEDDLKKYSIKEWASLLFVALNPVVSFEDWIRPIEKLTQKLPLSTLKPHPEGSRTYVVNCHWAIYCDNYLEGFHIPFVHPALNDSLDIAKYEYQLFDHGVLQIGRTTADQNTLPFSNPKSRDLEDVFAYYYWAFPNLMLNFYSWGLSVNVVEPVDSTRTKVHFYCFLYEGTSELPDIKGLHQTELEDEQVVEAVQKGISSSAYSRGRFSPTAEKGVHHFQRLIVKYLSQG